MTRPPTSETPVFDAEGDAFIAQVLEIVTTLPFRQAEALWHVDVCGESYATAARACGVSKRRFTKHLHTARREVLRRLTVDDWPASD